MQTIVDKVGRALSIAIIATTASSCLPNGGSAAGLKITNRPSDKVAVVPRPSPADIDLVKGLAELGASQVVLFPKGADVSQYIADKCGRPLGASEIHPAYKEVLLERNAGLRPEELASLPAQTALEIPACAKFAENVILPAPKGVEKLAKELIIPFDTGIFERVVNDRELRKAVQAEYELALGGGSTEDFKTRSKSICSTTPNASWPGNIASCNNAIQIVAVNPQITKPNLVKDVVVPTNLVPNFILMQSDRVALRTDLPETAIRAAIPNVIDLEGPLKFVTEVENVEGFGENCTKAADRRGEAWPYSLRDFLRVVSLNNIVSQEQKEQRILVVDTGFDFSDSARPLPDPGPVDLVFEPFYFHRLDKNSDADPQRDANEDGVMGNGGWVGVNLSGVAGKVSSGTSIVYKHRSHGLSVAALALGGRPVEELRRVARLPLRLGFASLVALDTENPLINTGHIEKALTFAAASGNDFHVVNLSLSSKDSIPGWQALVKSKGAGRVFVVAAGNDGKRLTGKDKVWPAAFGGEEPPPDSDSTSGAVISVGAHDSDGNIASFSNRGSNVDLLAPGCSVPTYELLVDNDSRAIGIVPRNKTGTSLAAPLVSFVSALLMNSPKLIGRPGIVKARILTSSDYSWSLRDDVYSSGILSIAKVLSIDNDVLEISDATNRSRTVRYGKVLNKNAIGDIVCQPGDAITFKTVRKIARSGSNNLLLFTSDDDTKPTKLKRKFCATSMLDGLEFEFRDVETGEKTKISGTSVLDYIRAL